MFIHVMLIDRTFMQGRYATFIQPLRSIIKIRSGIRPKKRQLKCLRLLPLSCNPLNTAIRTELPLISNLLFLHPSFIACTYVVPRNPNLPSTSPLCKYNKPGFLKRHIKLALAGGIPKWRAQGARFIRRNFNKTGCIQT